MTIHHDWDKTDSAQLAALTSPRMAWFIGEATAPGVDPMPRSKRAFDIAFALILLVPLSLVMLVVAGLLLVAQGRPILYRAHRMRGPNQPFTQLKFRTMIASDEDGGATGAHKHWRITRIGRVLRRSRIDELPQLFNILRGDMSFVGPRPPLREYVERFPAVYGQVLHSRPGVTGLATLIYHRHEDRILAGCKSAAATEAAYYRRCLPAKLKIDLIYQRHRSMGLDLWILWTTLKIVVSRRDERPRRRGRR
ncbi:sugar transferase [Paracoccus sp. (in: a-proteobacteria)]|uniref:sugar transferase n=1 Tax=Paracoccus sp. TaxID=267 RepID=UPI003FA75189